VGYTWAAREIFLLVLCLTQAGLPQLSLAGYLIGLSNATGDNPGQVAMTNVICQKESNLVLRGGSYRNMCKEHNRDIG